MCLEVEVVVSSGTHVMREREIRGQADGRCVEHAQTREAYVADENVLVGFVEGNSS